MLESVHPPVRATPVVPDAFRALTVGDAMTRSVYTVTPKWSLLDAARAMRSHHVSGMPVVDDSDRLVGVLSESDIVQELHAATGVAHARGVLDLFLAAAGLRRHELIDNCLHHLEHRKVADAMARRPVTVAPDDSLGEAARVMRRFNVNRVPVLGGERLVGILTRQDVVEALSRVSSRSEPAPRRFTRGVRADATSRAM